MARLAFVGSASMIIVACAALPACGQQDAAQQIIAQCSDPAPDVLDACLEEVRVQQETDPSPEMDQLLAKLIRRQVEVLQPQDANGADHEHVATPPPSPDLNASSADEPAPDLSPDDVAPPAEQGNPADVGSDDPDGQDSAAGDAQNPPPHSGGPGGNAT